MNVVILGAITKATVGVLGLALGLLLVLCQMAQARSRRRFLRQPIYVPSEFSEPRRINTHRLIDSPSRAPPPMTSKRLRGIPGSFGRE